MPSAGRYDYPIRPLDDVVPYTKKTYENAGEVATRDQVGLALGMASKGGGFATLVSAMQNYGLVETGGGQVKITELGKRVVYETDLRQLNAAKAEAVNRVELFRDYFAQYGAEVSDEKLKPFLRKAGVDVADLPKIAEGIGKLLKDNLHYIAAVNVGGQAGGSAAAGVAVGAPPGTGGGSENVIPINDNLIEFRMGTYLMRFPMDDKKRAKKLIDALLTEEADTSQDVAVGSGQ